MSEEKEYIVTLHNYTDCEQFYDEMETNKSTTHIPKKNFYCENRREISRNTHYYMTVEEAEELKKDDRVWEVEEPPENRNIRVEGNFEWDANTHFDKGGSTTSDKVQWGILRCYSGKTSHAEYTNYSGLVPFSKVDTGNEEGENVDVVIMDGLIDPNHPELAVNRDGTGGTRVVQRNWTGSYSYSITPGTSAYNHGIHVAGTAAGNRQGWAPKASIYNLSPFDGQISSTNLFDYVRTFHNDKENTNPTVCNMSFNYIYTGTYPIAHVSYRGTSYSNVNRTDALSYGIYASSGTQYKWEAVVTAVDADVQDCVDDGIILVGAGGNYNMKITQDTSDVDYNNNLREHAMSAYTYYYARGGSPTNSSAVPISVGSAGFGWVSGAFRNDAKSYFSNKGPRIDVFAPGSSIQSSVHSGGVQDTRNTSYYQTQLQGTSMASPQVTGVVACVVGVYRNFTQADVLDWLISRSTYDQIYDTDSAAQNNSYNLMGAPNRYLHFHRERKIEGHVFPDADYRVRDAHSTNRRQVYPRMKRNYNVP
jgi:hypothetical protein